MAEAPNASRFLAALLAPVDLPDEAANIAEAKAMVAKIRDRITAIKGRASPSDRIISVPQCVEGCRTCTVACAMSVWGFDWWSRELASLTGGLTNA